jgi:hypothetical protein
MNLLPHLTSLKFALAGMLCACGPVIIHLLNRRRFREVQWAAMDFLLEAFRRERRILRIRDWIVLALRTLAVLFFGLALARPFFATHGQILDAESPRHAILLIDNSLSMAYRTMEGTLLARAKREAQQLIDALPEGSQITLIPMCGDNDGFLAAFRSKADAFESLQSIQIVDRAAKVSKGIRLASDSLGEAFPLPDQVFLFTDMQELNWPKVPEEEFVSQLPSLSVCDLSLPEYQNTWVADLRIRDGVADLTTPATILAVLEHRGGAPRQVQVTLTVDQTVVATRRVELSAGHAIRELSFEHTFSDVEVEPGQTASVPIRVSVSEDRLPLDDQRSLIVPVVASLPVVFIDQYDDQQEDARLGRLGETRHIRQLLAPVLGQAAARRPLIDAQHVALQEVTRSLLAPARLVVMAGIADPRDTVSLLREYVEQGGPLVIAAGGGFDPAVWTSAAWLDGGGLLPAPLAAQALGALPDESPDDIEPFFLSFDSLASHPFFQLAGLSDAELRDLYSEPVFFKAVDVQINDETQRQLVLSEQRRKNQQASAREAPEGRASDWLLWQRPRSVAQEALSAEDQSELGEDGPRGTAAICARFNNQDETVFLAEREIGEGRVLFVSTGLLSEWNTIAQSNAVVMWDHILRGLIRDTLPRQNFTPQSRIALPLPIRDRRVQVVLERPDTTATTEFVDIGFVGREEFGVVVRDAWTRGIYRLSAIRNEGRTSIKAIEPVWKLALAVNGETEESQLQTISGQQRESLAGLPGVLLANGEQLLESGFEASDSRPLWRWLLLMVMILLFAELGMLVYPWLRSVGLVAVRSTVNEG